MAYFWVRNKKGQVAAEVRDNGLSVHNQALSWQLQKLKEAGEPPFSVVEASGKRTWEINSLLRFLEENGYTLERQATEAS